MSPKLLAAFTQRLAGRDGTWRKLCSQLDGDARRQLTASFLNDLTQLTFDALSGLYPEKVAGDPERKRILHRDDRKPMSRPTTGSPSWFDRAVRPALQTSYTEGAIPPRIPLYDHGRGSGPQFDLVAHLLDLLFLVPGVAPVHTYLFPTASMP